MRKQRPIRVVSFGILLLIYAVSTSCLTFADDKHRNERIVQFPKESIGVVILVDGDRILDDNLSKPIEAKGKIVVPSGKALILIYQGRLSFSKKVPIEFSSLKKLNPNDIQGFSVPIGPVVPKELKILLRFPALQLLGLSGFNAVDDECMPIIGNFKELKALYLPETKVTDIGMQYVVDLKQLEILHIYGTKITDAGLVYLRDLTKLRKLDLGNTNISDAGIENLKDLKKLEFLDLWNTNLTNEGLQHLKNLAQLKILNLTGTKVTDDGLVQLEGLKQLEQLNLSETKVSFEAKEQLKQILPKLKIKSSVKPECNNLVLWFRQEFDKTANYEACKPLMKKLDARLSELIKKYGQKDVTEMISAIAEKEEKSLDSPAYDILLGKLNSKAKPLQLTIKSDKGTYEKGEVNKRPDIDASTTIKPYMIENVIVAYLYDYRNPPEFKRIPASKIEQISPEMTLKEIIPILGPGYIYKEQGLFFITWFFDDGSKLVIHTSPERLDVKSTSFRMYK